MTINLRDIFSCPFSTQEPYELIQEPVKDPCGHIFEKKRITSYIAHKKNCPISGRPLQTTDLKASLLFQRAIEILKYHPELLETNNLSALADENKKIIEDASKAVIEQRTVDQTAGLPIRVPSDILTPIAQTLDAAILASKEFYGPIC